MLKEFRDFAMRGNVIDLAVGIIIGAAFTTIVQSLVNDIILPPIGAIFGDVDFSDLFIVLSDAPEGCCDSLAQAQELGVSTLNYGVFISAVINFLIVAFAVFMLVRSYNRLMERVARGEEETPADVEEPKEDPQEKLIATLEKLNATLDGMDKSQA